MKQEPKKEEEENDDDDDDDDEVVWYLEKVCPNWLDFCMAPELVDVVDMVVVVVVVVVVGDRMRVITKQYQRFVLLRFTHTQWRWMYLDYTKTTSSVLFTHTSFCG
jgi:hypothetical protein